MGGIELEDAITSRMSKILGRSSFHTDNQNYDLIQAYDQLQLPSVFTRSGLGGHTDTMFLEDRLSTLSLRSWVTSVLEERPGTFSVSGHVVDQENMGVPDVLISSGETHFTLTDANGYFSLIGLVQKERTLEASKSGWIIDTTPTVITPTQDAADDLVLFAHRL